MPPLSDSGAPGLRVRRAPFTNVGLRPRPPPSLKLRRAAVALAEAGRLARSLAPFGELRAPRACRGAGPHRPAPLPRPSAWLRASRPFDKLRVVPSPVEGRAESRDAGRAVRGLSRACEKRDRFVHISASKHGQPRSWVIEPKHRTVGYRSHADAHDETARRLEPTWWAGRRWNATVPSGRETTLRTRCAKRKAPRQRVPRQMMSGLEEIVQGIVSRHAVPMDRSAGEAHGDHRARAGERPARGARP